MSATTINSHAPKIRSLRSLRKPEDVEAMNIRFGVELETKVPRTCGIAVGGYHVGYPVRSAIATNGQQLVAPTFNGATWRADRDGSITCEPNEMPCEFVSPILHGAEGVESLCRFMEWMSAIGATVDTSCGVHITVGIESVIGSTEAGKISEFVRKLAHIAQWHAMSLYGQTGTGKSTLLQRMIGDDIARDEGVILIDPHGDLYDQVLASVPRRRHKDVFLLDPSSTEIPPGLNILDLPQGRLRRRHADFLTGELLHCFEEIWDMRSAGGPIFEMYFRNTLLLMCLQDTKGPTPHSSTPGGARGQLLDCLRQRHAQLAAPRVHLGQFTRVMADKTFRDQLLVHCSDRAVVEFWKEVAAKTSGDYSLANFVPYISCKVNGLTQGGYVAELLCAQRNEFNIGERMDRGEIILLNLNKGLIGGYESRLLGTVLMMEIFAAGLQRSMRPPGERRPVNIYVDEFQNFVSDNVASMLSEARKFGLRLTLANQTLAQLRANAGKQDLLEAVLGNVGNMILFRLGVPDAERLRLFLEPFSPREMQVLPNFHTLTRILTSTGPIRPVVMRTLK